MPWPPEILYQILTYQFRDLMSNDYPGNAEKFNENFRTFIKSNLTVNKAFSHICMVLAYRYCNLTTARRFHHLLRTLKERPELRNTVQIVDFQELTSIGLGRTGEMNRMIKNLTNETLLEFLHLTKFTLREFLACEHIQDDLDENIIYFLLRTGTVLSVLDFCGCSGAKFTDSCIIALDRLYRFDKEQQNDSPLEENYQITCLGLNDCTDLPSFVLGRMLRMLPDLQKLDLAHTSIDDDTLINKVPHLKSLTHLSLAMCLKLSPRAVLEFFSYHPAVTDENNFATLEWLNLYTTLHSSSWTEVHTSFLLKKLCQYGHNKTLQYLNLSGMPLHESNDTSVTRSTFYFQCHDALTFIKWNFPKLKSLSIAGNNIPLSKLSQFLTPIPEDVLSEKWWLYEDQGMQQLKFLNLSNNSYVNKWTIQDSTLYTSSPSLVALEVSFDAWQMIEKSNSRHEITALRFKNPNSFLKDTADAEVIRWRCYIDSSYGRRYWIYKVDPYLNRDDLEATGNVTKYDSDGNKIIQIVTQPDFLKFVQSKIMLGCGFIPLSSVRRKKCYRDLKPPISQFFTRNGRVTLGSRSTPIVAPMLPPGGWRVMAHHNENENISLSDAIAEENEDGYSQDEVSDDGTLSDNYAASVSSTTFSRTNSRGRIRSGLYWDRSMHDLHSRFTESDAFTTLPELSAPPSIGEEVEENDEEYLNDPSLQRNRSQLSLRRFSSARPLSLHQRPSTVDSSASMVMPVIKPQNYYYSHPHEFIYDPRDPETTLKYQLHLQVVDEYEVFGCIERGMYRYYSLRA
ncbi:probable F-box protein YLR352W [Zygosaccharomyces bailii]|nr:probable F-box protein YLR352W [Zygosaccharomyces bailii]